MPHQFKPLNFVRKIMRVSHKSRVRGLEPFKLRSISVLYANGRLHRVQGLD